MADSPPTTSTPSQKRPLEDPSSPLGPTDQPDAKRLALETSTKGSETGEKASNVNGNAAAPSATEEPKAEQGTTPTGPLGNGPHGVQADAAAAAAAAAAPAAVPATTDGASESASATATAISSAGPQPIQSTIGGNEQTTGTSAAALHQDESSWIHLRAVISSAEAATVIGKSGENVTQIRRLSGAKCTISDYSRGAVERILTVSGLVDAVAKVSSVRGLRLLAPRPVSRD